jgi:alkanesulfonate monooxygenase SsuD/methylene tetrahydromethanopterin reductase-like flavin-dependent oxidoreductase (luciferase family)
MKLDMTIAIKISRTCRRWPGRRDPQRDHVGLLPCRAFLPLALAAEHTRRVSLGTAIAVAFPRSPTIVAHTAWDLQAASGGRLILGLGTQVKGHMERRFSVKWTAPGPRLREYILALRALWDAWQSRGPVSFRGEHYAITLTTPFFAPGPIEHPRIPIYIAAVNAYNLRLAGELCDGVHLHLFHSVKYLREFALPTSRPACQDRPASERLSWLPVFMITADRCGGRARPRARPGPRSRSAPRRGRTSRCSPRTAGRTWTPRLHRKSVEGDLKGMAALITDEMLGVRDRGAARRPPRRASTRATAGR